MWSAGQLQEEMRRVCDDILKVKPDLVITEKGVSVGDLAYPSLSATQCCNFKPRHRTKHSILFCSPPVINISLWRSPNQRLSWQKSVQTGQKKPWKNCTPLPHFHRSMSFRAEDLAQHFLMKAPQVACHIHCFPVCSTVQGGCSVIRRIHKTDNHRIVRLLERPSARL